MSHSLHTGLGDTQMGIAAVRDRYHKNICHSPVTLLLGCCALAFVANPRIAPAQDSGVSTSSPGKVVIYVYFDPKGLPWQVKGKRVSVNGNITMDEIPASLMQKYPHQLGLSRKSYFDPQLGKRQEVDTKRVSIHGDVILDEQLLTRMVRYETEPGTTVTFNMEYWDTGWMYISMGTCAGHGIVYCPQYMIKALPEGWVLSWQYTISNAEAGKTYYVKWFFGGFRPMREKDGAKDIQRGIFGKN